MMGRWTLWCVGILAVAAPVSGRPVAPLVLKAPDKLTTAPSWFGSVAAGDQKSLFATSGTGVSGFKVDESGKIVPLVIPGEGRVSMYDKSGFAGNLPTPPEADAFPFGAALAFNGSVLAVGSPYAPYASPEAYLYTRDRQGSMTLTQKLEPGQLASGFGTSLDIDRDGRVAVKSGSGLYSFDESGKLVSTQTTSSLFLFHVGDSRPYLAIPAPPGWVEFRAVRLWRGTVLTLLLKDTSNLPENGIYLLSADTGELLRMLRPPADQSISANTQFAVDAQKGAIAITSTNSSTHNVSIWVFSLKTGALINTITLPQWLQNEEYAVQLALSGDRLFVGYPYDDANRDLGGGPYEVGSVYVFSVKRGTWLQTLHGNTMQENEKFGSSLAVAGKRLAIGAAGEQYNVTTRETTGALYLVPIR